MQGDCIIVGSAVARIVCPAAGVAAGSECRIVKDVTAVPIISHIRRVISSGMYIDDHKRMLLLTRRRSSLRTCRRGGRLPENYPIPEEERRKEGKTMREDKIRCNMRVRMSGLRST